MTRNAKKKRKKKNHDFKYVDMAGHENFSISISYSSH